MTGDPFTYLASRALRAVAAASAGLVAGAVVGAAAGAVSGWGWKPPDWDADSILSPDVVAVEWPEQSLN